jgi:hypothetical protein
MDSSLLNKITTLITGCDTECHKVKELNNLKNEYENYLTNYTNSYIKYQTIKYGDTVTDKQFKEKYKTGYQELNNKIKYIEKVLLSDVDELENIITQQNIAVNKKNEVLNNSNKQKREREKILKELKNNLKNNESQFKTIDKKMMDTISLFGCGPLRVNYYRSNYYLFVINLIIFIVIIFFIYKTLK